MEDIDQLNMARATLGGLSKTMEEKGMKKNSNLYGEGDTHIDNVGRKEINVSVAIEEAIILPTNADNLIGSLSCLTPWPTLTNKLQIL